MRSCQPPQGGQEITGRYLIVECVQTEGLYDSLPGLCRYEAFEAEKLKNRKEKKTWKSLQKK